MAKYTIELRKICDIYGRSEVENWFKSYKLEDALTPEQITVLTKFNVWSKEKLASMIVDHYFMREIGFETPALFKHYARVTMNEIMPRYLLQIYTQFLEYDPLSSVDYTEEYTREVATNSSAKAKNLNTSENSNTSETKGNSNSSSNSKADNLTINNNTPQSRISKQNLESGIYASSVSQSENNSIIEDETKTNTNSNLSAKSSSTDNSESSNDSKTLEKYTHSMKGDNGVIVTNQYLVREFRELAVSFNEQIIDELNTLFMGLY